MTEFKFACERTVGDDDYSTAAEALVGVVMGSDSDWSCAEHCCAMLDKLGIPFETEVTSAHRTPERMFAYARAARTRGLKVVIAFAGGSAHLPGMCAALTTLPVLAVAPKRLEDDLAAPLSSIRMPKGAPLLFVGFEVAGAVNAALASARILGLFSEKIDSAVVQHDIDQSRGVSRHPYQGRK